MYHRIRVFLNRKNLDPKTVASMEEGRSVVLPAKAILPSLVGGADPMERYNFDLAKTTLEAMGNFMVSITPSVVADDFFIEPFLITNEEFELIRARRGL